MDNGLSIGSVYISKADSEPKQCKETSIYHKHTNIVNSLHIFIYFRKYKTTSTILLGIGLL